MICAQECRMLPDYRWWDFTCTARTPPAGGVESESQATYDDETSSASAFHSTETDDLGTPTCRWARSRRAARRSLRPDGRAPPIATCTTAVAQLVAHLAAAGMTTRVANVRREHVETSGATTSTRSEE